MLTTVPAGDTATLPVLTGPGGDPFPFLMRHGTDLTGAETRTELLGALIPGYADLPDTQVGHDEALGQRWEQAVATAAAVQAGLVAGATAAGEFDPAAVGEDVLTALLGDRDQPFTGLPIPGPVDEPGGGDSTDEGPVSFDWPADLPPLILVATDYAPYTSAPRPHGNVVLLDPHTETTYLDSLAELGLIRLFVHANA
ncbi:hypothetical protein [Nakamurella multipartita]|uniref:Uncharacterized protein n=1 Tax=Nakamurella multipartita (strain ATCC 700099 / DSM 44233 / CIP 104796 / JCM 9543 / NBRC 105858 / Y-104) TaxID=479431 RepID=C8X8G8_NAKMY|nr:hypothetical protein [Nakamurella multipartita]ACV79023.1 hypothetical protein Namu_2677 [Nakamurella multipartita DSM 44233]